jgi:type I restriction enzyme M protein
MEWKFLEEQAFTGFDNDANMVKIAILNLYLHRLEKADIQFFNPLTQSISGTYPGKQFNVILANPPFSGAIQKESILEDINLATRDTEKLFLKWFFDHLASGGRAGVIIPAGEILSGRGGINLRKILLEQCNLKAIITLPAGAFKPYATVATAILIFDKQPPTRDVWFYELIADGFSMTGTRTPIDQNDIPDILERWPDRKEGPKSFRVSLEEIIKNGYELMPSSYKARTLELNNSGDPNEIINNILLSGNELQERLKNLLAQVKL